jgi:hypothetical protein
MTQHIMVDLETMDTKPTAAIVAIGAVEIDIEGNKLGNKFYKPIDLQSCIDAGCTVDGNTIQWWMNQSEDARYALRGGSPLIFALYDFSLFALRGGHNFASTDDVRIWGNGSDFDNVILAHAYRKVLKSPPWKYYNNRCFRTIRAGYPDVNIERTTVKHNALEDAIWQAQMLLAMIGGKSYG